MTESSNNVEVTDEPYVDQGQAQESFDNGRFSIGLTQFGHIGINVTDASGQQAGYTITNVDEASRVVMHLMALTNMMFQNMYAQAIAEQEMARELMNKSGTGGLWTPGS